MSPEKLGLEDYFPCAKVLPSGRVGRKACLPTLPETNSSSLKIGHPKRKQTSSNHKFSRDMLVSGSVGQTGLFQVFFLFSAGAMRYASTGLDVMSSIRGAFFSCDAKLLSW